ncbi:MAG TPA: hypothetical protein VE046_02375 [Steroidobacteraceae bacterium]|nr:hypothetical protein [Steroidobacteraceae bacterium]
MSERAAARACARFAGTLLLAIVGCAAAESPTDQRRTRQLEDLAFARTAYVGASKAFTASDRAAALKLIGKLERHAGSLSDEEFLAGVIRIAALAHNAHDSFDAGDGAWLPPKRAPFRMLWFPDALVIARTGPGFADLRGARVLTIEGRTPEDLLARLTVLSGGIEGYRRWNVGWFIENGLLRAIGLAKSSEQLRMELLLADGSRVNRTVEFVPRASMPHGTHPPRLWSAAPYDSEVEHEWRAATDPARDPLYLQEPDQLYRMTRINPIDALYVQLRTNDDATHAIKDFVADVEKRVESEHSANLVLDLRFDVGGNCDYTRELMRWLAAHVSGRIFVLTGPYTFSAGIVNAAAIKHDGGDRVTLVGDLVGDSLRWWSEGRPQCMPNSKLCLRPTTGVWDLVKGCAGEPACYGDQYDLNVGKLDPDLAAPLKSGDWLAGRDPGVEAIMAEFTRTWAAKGKVVH